MHNEFQYNLTHFLAYQPVFLPLAAHFLPALCCIEAAEKSPAKTIPLMQSHILAPHHDKALQSDEKFIELIHRLDAFA